MYNYSADLNRENYFTGEEIDSEQEINLSVNLNRCREADDLSGDELIVNWR